MLRPLRTTLAALLFCALPAAAQSAPALWEVSDADSHIWLFGSIHVLPPGVAWRTPAFDDALHQAEQVYFEADIGPLGQMALAIKSIQLAMAGNDPWIGKMTPEEMGQLDHSATPLGLDIGQLLHFQPWLAEAMVEEKVMEKAGFNPALGVDTVLQAELPKEKKAYFETAVGQMEMLAADPLDVQVKRLMTTVHGIDKLPQEIKDLAATWQAGDTDGLAKQVADDPTVDAAFAQRMVLDRNANWVTTLEQLLAQNHNDLVVVGAGHLVGDGSVVDLLSKAGFTVQRIQ